jgi:sigma-B regulation protein RsbU (phosphoserine phosphatase)
MPPLEFLATETSQRLSMYSQVMAAVRSGMGTRETHRAFQEAMRKIYPRYCYVEISTLQLPPGQFRITRVRREDGSEAVPDRSPWQIDGVPVRSGGVITQLLARNAPSIVHHLEIPPDDPVFPELGAYHSFQAVPGGFAEAGNWIAVFDRAPDSFDLDLLENMTMRVGLSGVALKNLQIVGELRRANAFIDAEVDRIAAIQRALLPSAPPTVAGLEVAASSQTSDRAGGDFYDYAAIAPDRLVIVIADASGHGPSAAVVAAMLNAILHTYPATRKSPDTQPAMGEVLTFANAQLADKQIEHTFVTAFMGLWNGQDHTLTYARAGQNPPLLRTASGELRELDDVGGIPLAILPETTYEQHVLELSSGDVLVLFTDGIIDAINSRREPFGEQRLREAVSKITGTASQMLAGLLASLRHHTQNTPPPDDQTLVVLRVT